MPSKQLQLEAVEPEKKRNRVKEFRERNGLVCFSVDLPAELVQQVNAHLEKKGKTKREAFEHLIKTQMLRKR